MSQAILDAFKAAAEIEGQDANGKPLYIDAVLTFINNNASALLTGANGGNFDDMPAGAGRQQAIAMGLHEIKSFFGDFDDIADLIAALDHQILVEHTKFLILENIKTAQSADELETALQIIEAMNDQRQELIEEWSTSGNAAAEARAAALEDEAYTIVLKEIASKLGTPTYLAALAEKIWAARANGPFYGVGTLVAALDAADQEIDDEALVSAFNAIDGTDPDAWQDALALIKNNTATLLDAEALAKLTTLPDGGGREKAIGLGVLEIKTLFGDFASIEDVQTAVAMQIEVEYAKYEFITALDAATTAAEMTDAILDTIELVHQHRQDLIEAWSNSGDPDAVARAAELANTDFTTVLAEIVSHLNDTAYMAELGVRMLALRSAQQGGKFFGDGRIITALAAADTAIEAEHDATITGDFTGALSEDGNGEVVADTLSVQDEDWGENVFQAVDAADLQKTYGTFAFDHETGAWTFTLNNDAAQSLKEGEEVEQTLTVTSFDGTAEKTITVTVTGTNDDPTAAATGNSVSGTVNTTITGNVPAGSDVDGDALTYELVGTLEGLTFNANGSFSYEPADDFTGNVTFQYKVKDPNGGTSAAQTFTITVMQPNRAPVTAATGNTASGDEDKILIGELPDATDADGDDLTYELVAPVAGLTLNADGTFSYAPAADFNGEVTFQYRAVDEHGEKSAPQTFTLKVKPVNDAPRNVSLSNAKIEENATAGKEIGKLTVSDPEGGAFTYELVDSAGGRFTVDATGTLKVADGSKLDFEQAMSHTVKVRVKDAAGATFEKSLTVQVTDVAAETVTGTATADVLKGGSGKDTFKGGAGDDKLWGGLGNDILTGDTGKDTFVFNTKANTKTNKDKITDFKAKDDSIWLDNAVFTKLGKKGTEASPAKLSKSFFTIGDKAKDGNDYLVYNKNKGVLYYDADGSGKGKAVEIASFSNKASLNEKDFFVI